VTNFASFGAPSTASVFGTAVASTPFSLAGGQAAFGGMRGGGRRPTFDEEEEDDDDGRQKVELREDSISLDQVCRMPSDHDVRNLCPLLGEAYCNAECMEECPRLKSTAWLVLIFTFRPSFPSRAV
jgi:hypothetical protein